MRLFGFSPTRATRPMWALAELGIDYEGTVFAEEVLSDKDRGILFQSLGQILNLILSQLGFQIFQPGQPRTSQSLRPGMG